MFKIMTSLVIRDSHVNRLRQFIGPNRSSAVVFNIQELSTVKYFGISGGVVSNNEHLRKFSAIVRQNQPRHLIVILGGNRFSGLCFEQTHSISYTIEGFVSYFKNL